VGQSHETVLKEFLVGINMRLTKGSMVHIGPYKLVVMYNRLKDRWNLMGTDPSGSTVALKYTSKDLHWGIKELSEAVESGDLLIIDTYSHKSVYDGRCDKGKYKISHRKPGLMAYAANIRWPWRN
jgi:hypothetical protein